jgi:AcrR family transcriptional regulator
MTKKEEQSAKERLLQAAVSLFAKKGYSATGLREIVKEAGVSVAMVNYHFGSKQALLEAILDKFFQSVYSTAKESLAGKDPPELKLRRYLRAIMGVFRKNPDLVRIAITELPNDMPGIVQFKAEKVTRMLGLVGSQLLPALPEEVRQRIRLEVVGPALVGMLTFHFLMRPVIQDAFQIEFDSSFYENYADELADIFMYGVFRKGQP